MSLVFALVVGVLFGSGVFLLLKPDLFRMGVGLVLISNAANLTLMGAGLARGQSPILPATGPEPIADPLVQAMTLTALVIGLAVTSVLLTLSVCVYRERHSLDLDDLSAQEVREAQALEASEAEHDEEAAMSDEAEHEREHAEAVG